MKIHMRVLFDNNKKYPPEKFILLPLSYGWLSDNYIYINAHTQLVHLTIKKEDERDDIQTSKL